MYVCMYLFLSLSLSLSLSLFFSFFLSFFLTHSFISNPNYKILARACGARFFDFLDFDSLCLALAWLVFYYFFKILILCVMYSKN